MKIYKHSLCLCTERALPCVATTVAAESLRMSVRLMKPECRGKRGRKKKRP